MANSIEPTRFVDAPECHLLGRGGHFTFETMSDIPKLWGSLVPHLGKIPGRVGKIDFGLSSDMNDAGFHYLAAVEIDAPREPEEGFETTTLPAGHYAVFTHSGQISDLCVTIDAIWHSWLPSSGRQLIDRPHMFERYDERFDPQTAGGEIEVWIPIKP